MRVLAASCFALLVVAAPGASAQENYESWPLLRSTFPSTGGGGIMIKGYDPVVTGGKCLTTFMAVEPGAEPKVYRTEEHTSELQSLRHLVCRLLLEKKKK